MYLPHNLSINLYKQWRNSALIIGGKTFRRGADNFGGGIQATISHPSKFGGDHTPLSLRELRLCIQVYMYVPGYMHVNTYGTQCYFSLLA